jgi:hypothetical protein
MRQDRQPYPGATEKIEGMGELPAGWNGHYPSEIGSAAQETAKRFLRLVWNEFGSAVPEPTVVAPTSDGGIALEWIAKEGDRERGIEVVCFANGRYEYSVRNRTTGRLDEGQEDVLDPEVVLLNVIKPYVAGRFILAR